MSDLAEPTNVAASAHANPVGDVFGAARPEGPDPLAELQRAEQGIADEPAAEAEPEVEYEIADEEDDEGFDPDEAAAALAEQYTPEQIAAFQQEFQERWDELAEEDPQAAVEALAELYRYQDRVEIEEQIAGEWAEQLAPVVQQHRKDHDEAAAAQLEADFGAEMIERHEDHMRAVFTAHPEQFLDPQTGLPDIDSVRREIMAAEYAYEQNFDWEAFEKAQLAPGQADTFGRSNARKVPVSRDQFDTLQAENARRLQRGAPPLPGFKGAQRTVHVEGGSGPQPQPLTRHVDPEIAAMDAIAHGRPRDGFGRRY